MNFGRYKMEVRALGVAIFLWLSQPEWVMAQDTLSRTVAAADTIMRGRQEQMEEVVVTGTLKAVHKLASPIPVESYPASYFRRNINSSLFESLQMVNGVQPQVSCNVCYTGSFQINGLEGPYTMVLIDGMPIVSSLSTVYGFSGIPNSMIRRIEVVKGPASTLYGSEAVAGVINIITKDPKDQTELQLESHVSSYGEWMTDVVTSLPGKQADGLLGISTFLLTETHDRNKDGFTDLPLQKRISLFTKWKWQTGNALHHLAGRLYLEDRWGGQLQWSKKWRGTDSIYGESIYTDRVELFGSSAWQSMPLTLDYSFNYHHQDAYYGTQSYQASQYTGFLQARWQGNWRQHEFQWGLPVRWTRYDDNSVATYDAEKRLNDPASDVMAGLFVQDEWKAGSKQSLLTGLRMEYHSRQGWVLSPRIAWKQQLGEDHTLRFTAGNGFRVVNLFTEDHAALSGAREVVIRNSLRPERSWNANINYSGHIHLPDGLLALDASLFLTRFGNKIVADYLSNPDQIIYDNLEGHAISRGFSVTADGSWGKRWRGNAGFTWLDVFNRQQDGTRQPQLFVPAWSGTYTFGYTFPLVRLSLDLTGRVNGPMHMPVVNNDYRPERSPAYQIMNIQATKSIGKRWECMLALKNILNYSQRIDPILRPFDPFDKQAADPVGNPNGYTFDPSYSYAPLQGFRIQAGFRYTFSKPFRP